MTAREDFLQKYANFQNYVDNLAWVKPASDKYSASSLSSHLFIAAVKPYATEENINRLATISKFIGNNDSDLSADDFRPLLQMLFQTVPLLQDMCEVDVERIRPHEAEKLIRYFHYFLAMLS